MKLSDLPRRTVATVDSVDDQVANDPIARRLRELGFVPGEQVEVMAVGPVSAEPVLVQVGFTRFALRRSEAARISVHIGVPLPVVAAAREAAAVEATARPQLVDAVQLPDAPAAPLAAVVPTPDPQARASA